MVYQVPYIGFPEVPPVNQMGPYDPMVGYILSDSLRWSDGAMRGTSADWNAGISAEPLSEQLVRVASAGFAGVWLDRLGYSDGGASEEREIATTTQAKPLVASNGLYVFYSLARLRQRLLAATSASVLATVGDETVHPVQARWGDAFYGEETNGQERWRWSNRASFDVEIGNAASHARTIEVTGSASTVMSTASHLAISADGRVVERLTLRPGVETGLRFELRLPHGSLDLHFESDAIAVPLTTDPRVLYLKLSNVVIEPVGNQRAVTELVKTAGKK
jgi:phosphoglycerol transferase